MQSQLHFQCVVLAGERPGGSPLARAFSVPAGVLVPVAGRSSLSRVLENLTESGCVVKGLVVGPGMEAVQASDELKERLCANNFPWLAPASGPAASALAGVEALDELPVLITAGDHALLTPEIVQMFCAEAARADADMVVGLVPYAKVRVTYPKSRRTVLRFSDEACCGSNLFAVRTNRGRRALRFWSGLEADRKKPWRIARKLGLTSAIRYLLRGLTIERAFRTISDKVGCTVQPVMVPFARAAVDVDSIADRQLAETILNEQELATERSRESDVD